MISFFYDLIYIVAKDS